MTPSDVKRVKVDGGKQQIIDVMPAEKLLAFGKKGQTEYTLQCDLPSLLKAPVTKGQVVGQANLIDKNGNVVKSVELVSTCDVQSKTYWDYVQQIATSN